MKNETVAEVDEEVADEGTRARVAATILRHGPSTATDIAEALEMTPAGVRRHLIALADAGDVVAQPPRPQAARGRGRPARRYALTPQGRATFYHAYDELAAQALAYLAETGGPQAVEAFAELRAAQVEQRSRELQSAEPDLEPTEALTRALNDAGFVAQTLPLRSGEQLCQHHCPVAHVAAQFPQLCEAETKAFSRVLDSHVQRLATIAHGDSVCTTHIPKLNHDNSAK